MAREVMKTHDLKFSNRPITKAVDRILSGGRDVVFSPYGEYWRGLKSLCVVHLLTNKMVRSFEKAREEEISLMMEEVEKASSSFSSVNLSKLIMTVTSDVMSRVALGRKYSSYEGTMDIKTLWRAFASVLAEFLIGGYIPSLTWIDKIRGLDHKLDKATNMFDDFLESVLQEHDDVDAERETSDFVDVLLSIQREKTTRFVFDRTDIKNIIFDIFFAATSTTSSLLEWTMTELLRHPDCMRRLQDEIRCCSTGNLYLKEDELEKLHYLKAVIKEVLRLHPPTPLLIPRQLSEDVKLKGYDITAGTQVLINAWSIHRDSATWGPDAEQFWPEKHFDLPLDFKGQDFKYIPFGSGRRSCPGVGFGTVLAEVTLANLVKTFDWKFKLGPLGDNKPDMAEATGLEGSRKFLLIGFPSSAVI